MLKSQHPNLDLLAFALERLGSLSDELVFLGGCAIGLLVDDPGAPPIRATRDVDAIVKVVSLFDYHRLTDRLRDLGFVEDQDPEAPICRWKQAGLLLDLMPTDPSILGFGNRWFSDALRASVPATLPFGETLRIVPGPYFLATKFEAFDGRGKGDYVLSRDMEDVVAVLDGRRRIVEEVSGAGEELRNYITRRVSELIRDRAFVDAIPGFLPPDAASQARAKVILAKMKAIATLTAEKSI